MPGLLNLPKSLQNLWIRFKIPGWDKTMGDGGIKFIYSSCIPSVQTHLISACKSFLSTYMPINTWKGYSKFFCMMLDYCLCHVKPIFFFSEIRTSVEKFDYEMCQNCVKEDKKNWSIEPEFTEFWRVFFIPNFELSFNFYSHFFVFMYLLLSFLLNSCCYEICLKSEFFF